MSFSLIVLIIVFLGIASRQLFSFSLKIWQWMVLGAILVLLTRQISWSAALIAVDWELISFLLGMFIVGQALEESGYLTAIISHFSLDSCHVAKLAAVIVFGAGLSSCLLMNDTLAIIGTPLLLHVARMRAISPRPLLLGLAFAITTGSTMTPIGNPQNFLIALQAPIQAPFITFITYLGIPTLISLGCVYLLVLLWLKTKSPHLSPKQETPAPRSHQLWPCHLAQCAIVLLIIYRFFASWLNLPFSLPLSWIALIPASFLLITSSKRKRILKNLDWETLLFFVALFILMASVWKTSALKELLMRPSWATTTLPGILTMSTLVSQLISNVPLVALYLPILRSYTPSLTSWMALAAGSTLAGNLLIFGAASNLIIIQSSEKRKGYSLPFLTFAKYGIPLTVLQLFIYWLYLTLR